jgi:hypothetical protein
LDSRWEKTWAGGGQQASVRCGLLDVRGTREKRLPILRPVREPGSTTGVGSIELPGVPAPPECATGISQRSPVLLWKIFKAEFFCGIVLSLARAGFLSLARFSLSLSRQHSLTRF